MRENACGNFVFVCLFVCLFFLGGAGGDYFCGSSEKSQNR